jgi:hypothetical protein
LVITRRSPKLVGITKMIVGSLEAGMAVALFYATI